MLAGCELREKNEENIHDILGQSENQVVARAHGEYPRGILILISQQRNRNTHHSSASNQPDRTDLFHGPTPEPKAAQTDDLAALAQASHQRLLRGGSQRSLVLAYLLLLVGGFFGLHHLYLGNVRLCRHTVPSSHPARRCPNLSPRPPQGCTDVPLYARPVRDGCRT